MSLDLDFVGDAIGGGLGFFGAKDASDSMKQMQTDTLWFNAGQAEIARDWTAGQISTARDFDRYMSNTAVTRRMQDLKRAGINPILAGKYDASTPSAAVGTGSAAGGVGVPQLPNKMAQAAQVARTAAELKNIKADTTKKLTEADKVKTQTGIYDVTLEFAKVLENTIKAITGKDEKGKISDLPNSIPRAISNAKEAGKIRQKKGIEVTPHVKKKSNKTKNHFTGGRYQ